MAPLESDFFKVAHHGSKRGVSFEILERLGRASTFGISSGPNTLVTSSATGSASRHGFPHDTTVELMREIRHPVARGGGARPCDLDLGIHVTSQWLEGVNNAAVPAGSVAWVVSGSGVERVYRFGDGVRDGLDLAMARRVIESSSAGGPDCHHCCGEDRLLRSVPVTA